MVRVAGSSRISRNSWSNAAELSMKNRTLLTFSSSLELAVVFFRWQSRAGLEPKAITRSL
jgi:hypothetical protein